MAHFKKLNILMVLTALTFFSACNSEDEKVGGGSVNSGPTSGGGAIPADPLPLPAGNTLLINSGNEATPTQNVGLTLASIGAAEVAVTNTLDCGGVLNWEPLPVGNKNWVLAQSNDTASVYAKFRNATGQESLCVSDTIVHDSIAPTAPVVTNVSEGATVEERSLTLVGTCDAAATLAVTSGSGVSLGASSCTAGALLVTLSFTSVVGDVARTVTLTSTDAAGNGAVSTRSVYLKQPVGFISNVFDGGVNSTVNVTALQSTGKILMAGAFTSRRIARYNSDGSVDTTFQSNLGTGANAEILALKVLADDSILIGGSFTQFNGVTVPRMAKLSANGVLDAAFNTALGVGPSGGSLAVQSIAVLSTGKIVVAGPFAKWNGFPAGFNSGIHRLAANGTLDATFSLPGASVPTSGQAYVLLPQTNGKIIVGARRETTINGQYTGGLFRLTAVGGLDTADGFAPTTTMRLLQNGTYVRTLSLDSSGGLLVGGSFTQFGNGAGVARTVGRLVRLDATTGAYDAAFESAVGVGFNGEVNAIGYQDDGKILVGGAFTTYKGILVGRLGRLAADYSLDTVFTGNLLPTSASLGFNSTVRTVIVDGRSRLIVGGAFSKLNTLNLGRVLRIY